MEIIYISATSIICILVLIFGVRVFSAESKNPVNRSFGFFAAVTALWMLLDFVTYQQSLAKFQTIFYKVIFAVITLMVFALANFINHFPKPYLKLTLWLRYLMVGSVSVLILLSLFSKAIVDHAFMQDYGSNFEQGKYFIAFVIYVSLLSIFAIFALIHKFVKSTGEERIQLKLLIYGLGLFLFFNLAFNLFMPMITHSFVYGRFGTYSTVFFVGFTAYAILKAHLFNMRVILTETAIVIINVILAIQIFSSATIMEGLLRAVFLMIVIYGSSLLLKSVRNEIKQKEEVQRLAKKLDKANQDLEELDEAKDNFLSMAAHELNTPIAAIEGYLSMILEENMGGKIPVKALGYLKNVFLSSKRLAGLVHDLLNVSRIESNRIHVVYAEAQIEDIIDQAITEVKIKADEVGHKLTFEKPSKPLPKTFFDLPRIVEVVINIIGNAIKYTDPPGKIDVKCHADDGKIVVSIEDNGRGIPKDRAEHVFEKFTQVNVLTDQIKGSGLGMFISKNLIELHKGKLWFESSTDTKDHGTTFYFSLPIIKNKPFDQHEGEGALFQTNSKAAPATTDAKEAPATTAEGEKPTDKPAEEKSVDPKDLDKTVKEVIKEAEKKPTTSLNERLGETKEKE